MGALLLLKDILMTIYHRIGLKGVGVLVLVTWLVIDTHRIGNYQADVKTLNTTISTQQDSIKKQNAAIEDLGKKSKDLQGKLDDAARKNEKLSVDFETMKKIKLSKGVAKTCEGAIAEVRSSAKDVADKWNSR